MKLNAVLFNRFKYLIHQNSSDEINLSKTDNHIMIIQLEIILSTVEVGVIIMSVWHNKAF